MRVVDPVGCCGRRGSQMMVGVVLVVMLLMAVRPLVCITGLGRRLEHRLPVDGSADQIRPEGPDVPEALVECAPFAPPTTQVDDETHGDDQQYGSNWQQSGENCEIIVGWFVLLASRITLEKKATNQDFRDTYVIR